jgi:hypothetical protein
LRIDVGARGPRDQPPDDPGLQRKVHVRGHADGHIASLGGDGLRRGSRTAAAISCRCAPVHAIGGCTAPVSALPASRARAG